MFSDLETLQFYLGTRKFRCRKVFLKGNCKVDELLRGFRLEIPKTDTPKVSHFPINFHKFHCRLLLFFEEEHDNKDVSLDCRNSLFPHHWGFAPSWRSISAICVLSWRCDVHFVNQVSPETLETDSMMGKLLRISKDGNNSHKYFSLVGEKWIIFALKDPLSFVILCHNKQKHN